MTGAVPVDPEPAQRALDLLDRLGNLAARVGVLDPEQASRRRVPRANSQLKRNVRTPPMWRKPVGLGAMRTRTAIRSIVGGGGVRRAHVSRRAGSTRRSTASRRSAATACRSSPRARACGGRRTTSRRRSSASRARRAEAGIGGVVCHALYLVNLAAPDNEIYKKSVATMRATVDAPCAIDADAVIFHVGSHLGAGFEAGLKRAVRALEQILERCDGDTWLLMENSAGAGATIGRSLDELATLFDAARPAPAPRPLPRLVPPLRLGLRRDRSGGRRRAVDDIDATIGLDRLRALHVNDCRDAARLEPRPPREHPRGRARRGPRRLPRASGLPAPRRATSRCPARTTTGPTPTRSRSCGIFTLAARAGRARTPDRCVTDRSAGGVQRVR